MRSATSNSERKDWGDASLLPAEDVTGCLREQRMIQEKAQEKKMSINRTIIGLLNKKSEGPERKKVKYHDLDDLSGSWNKEEAKAFDKSLVRQRTIDPDLWK